MKEIYEKIDAVYDGWDAICAQNIAENLYFGQYAYYGCLEEGEKPDEHLKAIYEQVFKWMTNEE